MFPARQWGLVRASRVVPGVYDDERADGQYVRGPKQATGEVFLLGLLGFCKILLKRRGDGEYVLAVAPWKVASGYRRAAWEGCFLVAAN